MNLLEPGSSPHENEQFLLFLCAVIKAVDDYQDLLRISVASAGNDHRLGANEAPPAIVSMFLGDELTDVLTAIENDSEYAAHKQNRMTGGVHVLPRFMSDTTDRNRTSPFAFTGNKFEFRMLGSTFSISGPNIVLNTIVAESLSLFADRLEQAKDFEADLHALIQETIRRHKRIIFNGNNYSDEWVAEAGRRGLLNLKTTADALPLFVSDKNIKLFTKHKIFAECEMRSRCDIFLENYCKVLNIEALTMIEMCKKDILPAVSSYIKELCDTAAAKKALSAAIVCEPEQSIASQLSAQAACLFQHVQTLENAVLDARGIGDTAACALYYKDRVLDAMQQLRAVADELETLVSSKHWPFPTYGQMLFGV